MRTAIFTLLCSLVAVAAAAEGIQFFKGDWQAALAEARRQDKLIFVDAYAEWCGPCKRMAAEVFTDAGVGAYYNEHFINVKMDMERGEGLEFRKKYPVSAFPTLMYIDFNGEMVHKVRGAQGVGEFLSLGKAALAKIDRSKQYAEAYEQGNRDPELVYNYVKALNRAGKSSLKIANDYLRSQQDLSTEANLRLILEAATESDSKIFEWLILYRRQIVAISSAEAVEDKILLACRSTMDKAVEFQDRELLDHAVATMKKNLPEKAEAFALEAEMEFALAASDAKGYSKACKTYADKLAKGDAEKLQELARNLTMYFREDAAAMKQAESIAKEAAETGATYMYYLTYANILNINGKKKEALAVADKCRELAKAEGEQAVRMVEHFIQSIAG